MTNDEGMTKLEIRNQSRALSKWQRNDEARMTRLCQGASARQANDEGMAKPEIRNQSRAIPSSFVLGHCFVIRHSSFVISQP